jgi:hypothetical protein
MIRHRLARSAALALAIAALAAPAAVAQQDLRSPDARDAARSAIAKQDLRSPDARDAAEGRGTFNAPEVTVVKVPVTDPAPSASPRDWTAVAIGAGAALGLVLLALGAARFVRPSVTSRTA